jgi:hypothetical protein
VAVEEKHTVALDQPTVVVVVQVVPLLELEVQTEMTVLLAQQIQVVEVAVVLVPFMATAVVLEL